MKSFLKPASAFSLVEVTLALGVAAFCLISILGNYSLWPVAEMEPTPGVLVDANNKNIVAIQVMGVGGNNKI